MSKSVNTAHNTPAHEDGNEQNTNDRNSSRNTLRVNKAFLDYMGKHWQMNPETDFARDKVAEFAAKRREQISNAFPGKRLVFHAGELIARSNDTFYQFRAHTAFTHLTGWGAAAEPGSVLLFEPVDNTHEVTLFFRERADKTTSEFFANAEIGEFWIGSRPSLQQLSQLLDIKTRSIHELDERFRTLESLAAFEDANTLSLNDHALLEYTSEMRLVKDAYEIEQMRLAVKATEKGFHDVVAKLQDAQSVERGERIVESVFHTHARVEGNWEGYETIAAAGPNACTLHWNHNTGRVQAGELLLLDAGIEVESLYTADITRTIPINGHFSEVQRKVYEAVLEAADAAMSIIRPGITFSQVHETAMEVIERKTREWGFIPEDPSEDIPYHKRYMVHGTSHHLGIDVHDCAAAKRELYLEGTVQAGMIFTVEPGLYFHPDDLTVPEEFRGIGVRIEDDILVTETGYENLSAALPRTVKDVEAWIQAAMRH